MRFSGQNCHLVAGSVANHYPAYNVSFSGPLSTSKGGLNSLLRHNIWKSTSSIFPNTSHILLHLTDQNLHISEGCKHTDIAIGEQMHGKQKHPIQSWAIFKVSYSTAEIQ